ncbi:MAG: YdcF family protein [Geminicoccaceae bacterium]|nr:YdcF family protein [Geminicoccaceae bacterium]
MSFLVSKLGWFLTAPSNVLVVTTALLASLAALTGRPLLVRLAALPALLLLLCTVLPVGHWLARPLEDRFPLPDPVPRKVDGIVVLGGAQDSAVEAARGRLAVDGHAERMMEGVGLARAHPEARLVFSGGTAAILPDAANERRVNERYVAMTGLDPARVAYEDRSRNTWENALNAKRLVGPAPGEVWLLVTSALHMPRAVGIFRRIGFGVVPYPVDYTTGPSIAWGGLWMASGRLRDLDDAAREWFGLAAYRLMGRTPALFPAP